MIPLPCPFCGKTPDRDSWGDFREIDGEAHSVMFCRHCGATGPHVNVTPKSFKEWRDRAIEEWNKRVQTG